MDLIVTRGEREVEVSLDRREDGRWVVDVGDESYTVDVADAGELLSLRLAEGTESARDHVGRQFEVAVRRLSSRGSCTYQVSSRRGTDHVSVTDPLTHLLQQANPGAAGGGVVEALMPGRVVEVLVAEGADVAKGQGVVVLEAMKMKNEIPAELDGSVKKIHVEAGQNVDAGDPLFEVG
ncbi:MAG: biotin/lipoyl-containing protein [Acidobacteriota bacterium]